MEEGFSPFCTVPEEGNWDQQDGNCFREIVGFYTKTECKGKRKTRGLYAPSY